MKFPNFLRTPFFTERLRWLLSIAEILRLHVKLLLMFELGEKFNQGILVCILLSLYALKNNVIEKIWKRKVMNLMNMHFFLIAVFF